jgi:hypothetical protein
MGTGTHSIAPQPRVPATGFRTYTRLVLVFTTERSQYALDSDLGLLLQLPGGTPCGLEQGVWHRAVWRRAPVVGEHFFYAVLPDGGGEPLAIHTGDVTWVSSAPLPAAYGRLAAAR